MKNLPVSVMGKRLSLLLGRSAGSLGKRYKFQLVSVWPTVPEAELARLSTDEKRAYIGTLTPLVRTGHRLHRENLSRIYQLFAFMQMPPADRYDLLSKIAGGHQDARGVVFQPSSWEVRSSLVEEVDRLASNAPSRTAFEYAASVRVRLGVRTTNRRKLSFILEKLTDIENAAAVVLGKSGHVVRQADRRRELLKKSVAAIGVPAAILYPLGTIGLSSEGVTTGLLALGGGFFLPAGAAMFTGLAIAVAIGLTSKKILDMLMPTVDSDRASVNVEELDKSVAAIEGLLNEAVNRPDAAARAYLRQRIVQIIERITALTETQRSSIQRALNHADNLREYYLSSLEIDGNALRECHPELARELRLLREAYRTTSLVT